MNGASMQSVNQADKGRSRNQQEIDRAETFHRGIMSSLHSGQIVPGQRLVEADLCEMYDLPRGFIREALRRLESEGLVEIIPFRGARIRIFSEEEAGNIDLTITALMALASRQAAAKIDEGDARDRLLAAMAEVNRCTTPMDYAYAEAREKFYRTIIAISANTEIARICPLIQGHLIKRRLNTTSNHASHLGRLARYQTISDAICRGDGKAAEAAFWAALSSQLMKDSLQI
jgi:DNA-binding GntR family transcriptional regulator